MIPGVIRRRTSAAVHHRSCRRAGRV